MGDSPPSLFTVILFNNTLEKKLKYALFSSDQSLCHKELISTRVFERRTAKTRVLKLQKIRQPSVPLVNGPLNVKR